MLNHAKSVGYGSSLFLWLFSFEFVGQWALFSGHFFFGAGNSEKYLNQFSGKRGVRAVGAISKLNLGF
ncbi:hypothetical protein BOO92_20770 [Vibrio navarrensis]|nr:hypothetical protein [Vibrio navarrensis]